MSRIVSTSYYLPVAIIFYPMLQYLTNKITRIRFCLIVSNQFKASDNLEFFTNFRFGNKHRLFVCTLP